jgi:hypothetical protein
MFIYSIFFTLKHYPEKVTGARFCKTLRSPGIDSPIPLESIPLAYVAWPACATALFVIPPTRLHKLAELIIDSLKSIPGLSLQQPQWHTVRKMDPFLCSIERMLQMQLSMDRRFKLQVLHNVKFSKMRNFTLETP